MKNLIEYLNVKNTVFEGVNYAMFDKYIETIRTYISKHGLFMTKTPVLVSVGSTTYIIVYIFSVEQNNGCNVMWEVSGNHNYVHSVSFTRDNNSYYSALLNGGKTKFDVMAYVKDMSLANLLPFIVNVLTTGAINIKAVTNKLHDLVNKYGMFENLQDDEYCDVNEDLIDDLKKERHAIYTKINYRKKKGEDFSDLETRLNQIKDELASNAYSVKGNVTAKVQQGFLNEIAKQEEEFQMKATPEERFSDMEHYINMVVKGLQPSLLICGAPGVGKTFRVMKAIKASGLNYKVVKGKETATACYQDLFLYSRPSDILIFDDADDVLNDEVITNLLKAATDSSDERIVSYGTSKPHLMTSDEFMSLPMDLQSQVQVIETDKGGVVYMYPKSFVTQGRIIIITNKNAGQIDTAVRNRGLICDLAFTVEECLEIINGLMPHIMPDKLSNAAKQKALSFLEDLAEKGSKMEISIRSFTTVAKVYEDVDDTKQAERMIREQMYLQALRGGKKY